MNFTSIFALLGVCAPFIAHAQPTATPGVAASVGELPMAPKSAETSDAFVWRFAPPIGSRWTMRSFGRSTSTVQTSAIGGNKAESRNFKVIQKMTADYDIVSRDALGATTILMTLREMTNDVATVVNGKSIPSPLAKLNPGAINGATLTIKQSREGKVWASWEYAPFSAKFCKRTASLTKRLSNKP